MSIDSKNDDAKFLTGLLGGLSTFIGLAGLLNDSVLDLGFKSPVLYIMSCVGLITSFTIYKSSRVYENRSVRNY